MANSLIPSVFSGLSTEDAGEFISDVENWFKFRKLSNDEVKGCFYLLPRDGAKYWYSALDDMDIHSNVIRKDPVSLHQTIHARFRNRQSRYVNDGGCSTGTARESGSLHRPRASPG